MTEHEQQQQQSGYNNTKDSSSVGGTAGMDFTIPAIFGAMVYFAWLITMLVIEATKITNLTPLVTNYNTLQTVFGYTAPPFLIQATTFAAGLCIVYYISTNTSYYLISAVYNFIIVCIWLLMLVPAYGFFAWRHSDDRFGTNPFPTCFYENPRPTTYDKDLCNAYKASSLFSFFIMVVHFIWFVLHTMKAMGNTKLAMDGVRGVLAVLAFINVIAFIIWFAGRLTFADKNYQPDPSLYVYIGTLSVCICTLLILIYLSTSTSSSTNIIMFNLIWHSLTTAIIASVVIFEARTTDNDSKIGTFPWTTDSGKAIVSAQLIMLCVETISTLIFIFIKMTNK